MYTVALLVELELAPLDVDQVISLHEGLDEPVEYRIVMPVNSSPQMLATSLGGLGAGQIVTPATADILIEANEQARQSTQQAAEASAKLFTDRSQTAVAAVSEADPVEALTALVRDTAAAEAIIMTSPHLVSEFFHVDWTSRARRKLQVPTLHLLEHVPLSGQAI